MDAKTLRDMAEAAAKEGRATDAGRLYLQAHEPYEAALAFQKGKALKECLDALLKVSRTSASYRAACVHATRVAGMLGEKLTRLSPLVGGFLETSPATHSEATVMKELAETRTGSDAANIYRRVLAAYPGDTEAKEALQQLLDKAEAQAPFSTEATGAVGNQTPAPRPSSPKPSGKRFTEILVARGRLTQARLMQVITVQRELEANDLQLGEALVADGTVSELDVVKALSEQSGIPYISGARLLATATAEGIKQLPVDKAVKWKVCPIALIDRHVWVAMRDPRDFRLSDQLRFACGHAVNGVFATETAIRKAVQKYYYGESVEDIGQEDWRAWDQMPMVTVSRFSDRFTGTREHEFDTQEMIAATSSNAPAPAPASQPSAPTPRASPTAVIGPPRPLGMATLETLRLLAAGDTVAGRYRLEATLGQGGSATVFQAHDLELDEKVALKLFAPSARADSQVLRYKNELSLSRQLSHPNIIRLFDLGAHEGWRYLSMELLEGIDLASKLEELKGPMPLVEGLIVLEQACTGLQYAHDNGVIHRDIKPGNLFITTDGVVKVMDFGIAKKDKMQHITAEGVVAGTPEYMSPEQISAFSTVTHLTDLYALGCTAYAAFSGAPPFTSPEVMSVLMQQTNNTPESLRAKNASVTLELDAAVHRLLAKEPAKRFQSCSELSAVLKRIRLSLAK